MVSFNAYGSTAKEYGKMTKPVWLGNVAPHAVGGVLASGARIAGALYPAGTPVKLASGVLTPFIGYEVVSFTGATGSETYDSVVIKPAALGGVVVVPSAEDIVMKVGATFATAGAARAIASVTPITEGTNAGYYTITILHSANLGSLTAGDVLTPSASAGASGKYPTVQPNAYLYNDIYLGDLSSPIATGAAVDFHGAGLLIDFTPASNVRAQMKAAVPNVIQVEFPDGAFVEES